MKWQEDYELALLPKESGASGREFGPVAFFPCNHFVAHLLARRLCGAGSSAAQGRERIASVFFFFPQ